MLTALVIAGMLAIPLTSWLTRRLLLAGRLSPRARLKAVLVIGGCVGALFVAAGLMTGNIFWLALGGIVLGTTLPMAWTSAAAGLFRKR